MFKISPVITSGVVHGSCPKCQQPYLGTFDADETSVDLSCVGCGHKGFYKYVWPDDLPQFLNLKNRKTNKGTKCNAGK